MDQVVVFYFGDVYVVVVEGVVGIGLGMDCLVDVGEQCDGVQCWLVVVVLVCVGGVGWGGGNDLVLCGSVVDYWVCV